MRRYAVVDLNSGNIWGVVDAEGVCDACRIADETGARLFGREYKLARRGFATFEVFLMPGWWGCEVREYSDPNVLRFLSNFESWFVKAERAKAREQVW